MTPDQRAAWLDDVRAVLDVVEAHPEIPDEPYISKDEARFYLIGLYGPGARRVFAATETALADGLGVTFTGAPDEEPYYYLLTAVMPSGLRVVIRAVTSEVAERKVTGTRTVEDIEWVRLPAGPPAGQPGAQPEAGPAA